MTKDESPYSREFFSRHTADSPSVIVPLLMEYVKPSSIVDVGCGTGQWLSTFSKHGVDDYLGVDASWVDMSLLAIPPDKFLAADLEKPLDISREFSLSMCLEVAEHLSAGRAASLVEELCRMSPVVLFSAAIPGQGGIHHINEQWQSFWAKMFAHHGFVAIDLIRPRLWSDENVDYWYRQNILLYVRKDHVDQFPSLAEAHRSTRIDQLDIVHPFTLSQRFRQLSRGPRFHGFSTVLKHVPLSAYDSLYEFLKRGATLLLRR